MKPVRILTVDDEPLALRRLQLILSEMRGVEHVGSATSCRDAVRRIKERSPDIVLLDIRMRDGTGFDVVDRLDDAKVPAVIFVTAFNDYASRAFEVSAVDYVLKPVQYDRLHQAIERAQQRLAARDAEDRVAELRQVVTALRARIEAEAPQRYEAELWVRGHRSNVIRVAVASVDWIAAEVDYVRLHVGERSFLLRDSIAGLQKRLDPEAFIRIHRATLVRIGAIAEIKRHPLGFPEVHLTCGQRLRVGRVYAKSLRQRINARRA